MKLTDLWASNRAGSFEEWRHTWAGEVHVHGPCGRHLPLNGYCFSQELPVFSIAMCRRSAEMSPGNKITGQPLFSPLAFGQAE